MPEVSVVVPAYNAMRFLPQTVDSALAQTWQDFELIIVNDGSTDGTEAWLSRLRDPRVRFVTQSNLGLSGARNTGIAASQREYIAFLDADDLWEPTKLEAQVARLDAHPEVGLVHTAIRYIDEQGNEINRVLGVEGEGEVWQTVVLGNPVRCGSTPLVRRACFEAVGVFDPSLRFSEDWDMWLRIAAHYHFAVVNKPLVRYRQHSANMTKNYQLIMPHFERILEQAFQHVPAENAHLKQEAYGRAYLFAAWRAFYAHDFREASTLQKRAFRSYEKLRYAKNSLRLSLNLARARWLGQES